MVWLWAGFIVLVLLLLLLDLSVFHRKAHVDSVGEAFTWSAMWISLGLSFSVFVYFAYAGQWLSLGTQPDPVDGVINDGWTALQKYLTGYVVEKSLSMDNIFVIAVVFGFFAVPALYRHRVLFWGIVGAVVMQRDNYHRHPARDEVSLGPVRLWRVPDRHGLPDAVLETGHKDPNQNILVPLARRWFPSGESENFIVRPAASQESHSPARPSNPTRW